MGLLVLGSPLAFAQQRTTATFDDWTVSCATPPEDSKKACEMVQVQTVKDQQTPLGTITIGRIRKDGPFKIVFQIPPTVWIESGVKFVLDDKDPGLPASLKWCINTRCLAEADLPDSLVTKLRTRTDPAKLAYKEATQRDVLIPVSFKGFGPAIEYMQKQ
jgi:invasion protein IalB